MASKPKRTRTTAEATKAGLRVFLAGIPWRLSEEALWRDFGECGAIEDLFLLKDADGNSRGRAFIQFHDAEGAQAALAYNETDYGGRMLYVKLAEEKRQESTEKVAHDKKQSKDGDGVEVEEVKPEGCTSLCLKCVGAATEEEIRAALPGCDIQAIRIVKDRDTGKPRGIAFVDFVSTQDVDTAMSLDCIVSGQKAVKSYETPKLKPRPEGCLSVVVKPLGPAITNDELKALFRACKKSIADVRVIRNKNLECTGLAFVDFHDGAAVERAVRLSGSQFQGKTVFVGYETKSRKLRADEQDDKKPRATDKQLQSKGMRSQRKRQQATDEAEVKEAAGEMEAKKKKNRRREPEQAPEAAPQAEVQEAAGEMETKKKKKKRRRREPEQAPEAALQASSAADGEGDGEEVLNTPLKPKRKRRRPEPA